MWEDLEIIFESNYDWNLIGYLTDDNNKIEININWESLYRKLDIGEYRLVKEISIPLEKEKYYSTVEFIIN